MRTFRKINGELCMSVQGLATSQGISVESATNTIKKGLKVQRKLDRDSYRYHPDPEDNRKKWLVVETLPEVVSERAIHYYGDLKKAWVSEALEANAQMLIVPTDRDALRVLPLSVDCQDALMITSGWCRALIDWNWREVFSSKIEAYSFAAQIVFEQQMKGLKISNGRRLCLKLKAFESKGIMALVSKKIGNSNAKKSAAIADWYRKRAIHLYSSPLKPTVLQVSKIIRSEALENSWKPLSAERIRQILNEPGNRQLWLPIREGRNAARQLSEAHVKRRRPSRPDALWSVDGTTVQLYSQEDGKLLKEWYMVIVTDGCTDAILGCGLGKTENSTVVQRAIQSAAYRQKMLPDYIQYDHASANMSKETQALMDKMKVHKIPAEPYNGKSKYVERVIGRFEQNILRAFPNFVGGNITGRSRQSKSNPDFIGMQLKQGKLPSRNHVEGQLLAAVEVYNCSENAKGEIPIVRYTSEGLTQRRKAKYLDLVDLFWVTRSKELRYNNEGLRMEVNRERLFYEVESKKGVEDQVFRQKYLGDKFQVKYNPSDLTAINLYQDGKWIATAVKKYEFASVPGEREEGEGEALYERLADRKDWISDGVEEANKIADEMLTEGFAEASFELVHKDALNRIEDEQMKQLLTSQSVPLNAGKKIKKKRIRLHDDDSQVDRLLED